MACQLRRWLPSSYLAPSPACAVRALLASKVPPEGPWELQGIELLSQNELYRQVLLLLHLLPQDMLLLQVRAPFSYRRGCACPTPALKPFLALLKLSGCLSPQPCQSSYCYCQEVLDRLIQCGLLVAEEVGRATEDRAPAWALQTLLFFALGFGGPYQPWAHVAIMTGLQLYC